MKNQKKSCRKPIFQSEVKSSRQLSEKIIFLKRKPSLHIKVPNRIEKQVFEVQPVLKTSTSAFAKIIPKRLSLSSGLSNKPSQSQLQFSPKSLPNKQLPNLNYYEKEEIKKFEKIYYSGHYFSKISPISDSFNFGYDLDDGNYKIIKKDHLAYRYEIVELIGKGSYGSVCKCFDHKKQNLVAIKILKNKQNFHEQGKIEISVLETIKNNDKKDKNNLIKIKYNFLFRNHICLVFPLMYISVYDALEQNHFQGFLLEKVKNLTGQIISGLIELKALSLIHCDLKPENLLFVDKKCQNIKIIDFGSACFVHERLYCYIQSRFYRAPEVILGLGYSLPIDMWSLGCIVAEMATGNILFDGNSENEQLMRMVEVIGLPSKKILNKSCKKHLFFDESGKKKDLRLESGETVNPNSKPLKFIEAMLTDFLYKCLKWDPEARITPTQALMHPLFEKTKSKSLSLIKQKKIKYKPEFAKSPII